MSEMDNTHIYSEEDYFIYKIYIISILIYMDVYIYKNKRRNNSKKEITTKHYLSQHIVSLGNHCISAVMLDTG